MNPAPKLQPKHLSPNSEVPGARPPRAWLDAPSRPAFSARDRFPAGAQFPAAGVFREGAENSARGGRAPLSISEFGVSSRDPMGRDGISASPAADGWLEPPGLVSSRVRVSPRNPEGFNVNSRGRQPTVGRAKWRPALEGPNSPPATFDPCRVGPSLERDYRGLHPRLFTFRPCGLSGLGGQAGKVGD